MGLRSLGVWSRWLMVLVACSQEALGYVTKMRPEIRRARCGLGLRREAPAASTRAECPRHPPPGVKRRPQNMVLRSVTTSASEHTSKERLVIQALILGALVIQSAGVSLLARYMFQRVQYSGGAVSFLQELVKFPVAIAIILGTGRPLLPVLRRLARPSEVVQIFVPAGCFAVQNVLFFVAHERIPATAYLVLSQTKSIFTALFSVLLLPGKQFRRLQWLSQPVLVAGAVMVMLPQMSATATTPTGAASFLGGAAAAVVSALVSGFANVYFERLVKTNDKAFWPRQLQLALATSVFTIPAIPGGLTNLPTLIDAFTPGVWAIVSMKAVGGLLIGGTIVYTSAVTKNYATALAIGLSAMVGGQNGPLLTGGLALVFLAMALFNIRFANNGGASSSK